MTLSRRSAVKIGAGLGAMAWLDASTLLARQEAGLITKAIPSSGERIPVIGLGSARTFNIDPDDAEASEALDVVRQFHELRGAVIDTAPSYGRSEAFVGRALAEIEAVDDMFLATKVNVEGRGVDAAFEQMEQSSRVLGKRAVDLMQVWNLGDNFRNLGDRYLPAHLDAVREWKRRGRARYIGITTSFSQQYALVEEALEREELDFVQIDYSIGDRVPEDRLLPLAAERGVAVLINQPFSTGGLFSRVAGRALPVWTEDFDCESWAQFFLKYIVSHPAVTCAIPATSDPEHLVDNMGACYGRLPDPRERRRMAELFESF
jgi:aryl-alcohol dehydrogenase-like predicted oxidoreductase